MATIILEPGEAFEHYHNSESHTTHVEGDLALSFNENTITLSEGQMIIVPANTSHTVKNTGMAPAIFQCQGHLDTEQIDTDF